MRSISYLKGRSGIYAIVNSVNNKLYIGKTKDMYARCSQYIYDFRERSIGHLNDYLYNAMKKVGLDKFDFVPLEFAPVNRLAKLELKWMDQTGSCDPNHGYNLRRDSRTGMITDPRTSEKIRRNLKRQWANGERDDHGEKLRNNWENNPERRKQQAQIMRKNRTKWVYSIMVDRKKRIVEYAELQRLGYGSALSSFQRKKTNTVNCKGATIERMPKGEQ